MSMGDAVELHDYWREHPPTHLILGAVYAKPGSESRSSQVTSHESSATTESDTMQQFFELQQLAGHVLGQPREMPAHLKELADYAEEMVSKMRPN
jgi:hypothetical protein